GLPLRDFGARPWPSQRFIHSSASACQADPSVFRPNLRSHLTHRRADSFPEAVAEFHPLKLYCRTSFLNSGESFRFRSRLASYGGTFTNNVWLRITFLTSSVVIRSRTRRIRDFISLSMSLM